MSVNLDEAFPSRFSLQDRVIIDGARDIKAVIIGILIRPHGTEIECSWLHNGTVQTAWIAEFRLEFHTD